MSDQISNEQLLSQLRLLKERYIRLVNKTEVLLKWDKPQLEALYAEKIGTWLVERLQAQLLIKALQLKMDKFNSCINTKQKIDLLQIEMEVAAMLAAAEKEIMTETAKISSARELPGDPVSPERSGELHKLYRELAKQLHPGINSHLTPDQIKLWYIVKEAYENEEVEMLKAMKIVYEKELSQAARAETYLPEEQLMLKIAVLKEEVKVLQDQVLEIKKGFPFTIEADIKDDEWVNRETLRLKEELDQLKLYEEKLTLQYQHMLSVL